MTAKEMKKKLILKKEHLAKLLPDETIAKADEFCEGYKKFLDTAKTEREAVSFTVSALKKRGFSEFNKNAKYKQGDKFYKNHKDKALIACIVGEEDIADGVRLVVSHIDSPRIDLKQNPVYEDAELAFFKTHYYGGIKKYQWTALPLALHGVVMTASGNKVEICIGEEQNEPVFCITDLLPHLAAEQNKRKLDEGIKGEELNVLIGSRPFRDDKESELVKLNILKLLNEKYGIIEADFMSAELELVPAHKAADIGFDRSLVGAYGHDDRVCAYPSLMAMLDLKTPKHTAVIVLSDKEEIGSLGNTGLDSTYLQYFIEDLADMSGVKGRDVLSNSKCISADVNTAFDPTYPQVTEKRNAAYLNYGVAMSKYTGRAGKADSSDASAEFVSEIRQLFDKNDITWQTAELGAVDIGGGGTVAKYIAYLNVDVVDIGVPVLSMHSPFEIVSKLDTYMAYRAFSAFMQE